MDKIEEARQLFKRGKFLFDKEENFDEALNCFNAVLDRIPNFSEAHNYIGYCFFRKGCSQTKEISEYLQAIFANPNNPESYTNIGGLYLEKIVDDNTNVNYENFLKAILWYQRAIDIEPRNSRALNNLGHAYKRIGDFKTARILFNQVLEFDQNYENSLVSKAILENQEVVYLNKKEYYPDTQDHRFSIEMKKTEAVIDLVLFNGYNLSDIMHPIKNCNLPSIDYIYLKNMASNAIRYNLNEYEELVVRNIAVPLKRMALYQEANNIYKFLYYFYGPSFILLKSWFKVLACVGMLEEALLMLNSALKIHFNRFGCTITPGRETLESHIDSVDKCFYDNKYKSVYLKEISGNYNYCYSKQNLV